MKMLSGASSATAAKSIINGKKATINNPRDARHYNIETIYQTLALADNLDAASNLFLGREIVSPTGLLDDNADGGRDAQDHGPSQPELPALPHAGIGPVRAASASRSPSPARSISTPRS